MNATPVTTGTEKWSYTTGSAVNSSPAIGADGTIYVSSDDGKVYALNAIGGGLANTAWPMFGQNVSHTHRAP